MRHAAAYLLSIAVAIGLLTCMGAAGIRYHGLPTAEQGALHFINFDVGQADALFVTYKGKSMLFDCGAPNTDPLRASRRIPRRLDGLLGTRHIDYFVVSHYHQDHVGSPGRQRNKRFPSGIYSLLERDGVTVGQVIDRGFWGVTDKGNTQKHYERGVQRWLERGIVKERRQVNVGDLIDMGEGLEAKVVSASANGLLDKINMLFPSFIKDSPPSENDYSIGIKFTLGDFEAFSAGDLSGYNVVRQFGPVRQAYTDVESRVAGDIGPVEFYRVNHHGSRHSTNPCFAQVLHPQVSVFSTGKNTYGHPAPEVYNRLKGLGDVYITGGTDERHREVVKNDIVYDDVEILVSPDGAKYWVNGKPYDSLSEGQEAARPAWRERCDSGESIDLGTYEYLDHTGEAPSD